MSKEEEVVHLKFFDKYKGDVVFEGKVSTDVEPHELVKLRCFLERDFYGIYNKATNEEVKSFKGLQNNVELLAGVGGSYGSFAGVLYVGADDKVLRKSKSVPSCECKMMSVWYLSHEECEKVFKCEMSEELEISNCQLRQIPKDVGKMKKLKKLTLDGLEDLHSIPEEIGELSSLEELRIDDCGIESLPKRLKDLKMLKFLSLARIFKLQLCADDLAVFSKLKQLKIEMCSKVFTPSFTQSFLEMIKSTVDLRVLELIWNNHDEEMVDGALEENGSIIDGGLSSSGLNAQFERNKSNHKRARDCAVYMLAIRRWRNALNGVPKEMVKMIAMMLWDTKCDIEAWTISDKPVRKKARSDE